MCRGPVAVRVDEQGAASGAAKPRVAIVSMMKDGTVSAAVRNCFRRLGIQSPTIYRYDDPTLYSLIADGPETHWFFTGNTPDFVTDADAPGFDPRILTITTKMMFFVCYSHQYVCAAAVGLGAIEQLPTARIGYYPILIADPQHPLFKGIDASTLFFAYYTQYINVERTPRGWDLLASSGKHIAIMKKGSTMFSCQVHPERSDTTYKVLQNWLSMRPL